MNTAGMSSTFKVEILKAVHDLSGADAIKAALYLAAASISPATPSYTATGEVAGTNYTPGGIAVTNANPPSLDGTTAVWTPSADLTFTNVTLATPFDCALTYNSSKSNKSMSVHTFGAQVITAGNFVLTVPADDAVNALIRIG